MVGDLAQGRTVRSLTYLLSKYQDIRIYFVAPTLPEDERGYPGTPARAQYLVPGRNRSGQSLPEVDVVYQTRIQKERFGDRIADYENCRGVYVINRHASV